VKANDGTPKPEKRRKMRKQLMRGLAEQGHELRLRHKGGNIVTTRKNPRVGITWKVRWWVKPLGGSSGDTHQEKNGGRAYWEKKKRSLRHAAKRQGVTLLLQRLTR